MPYTDRTKAEQSVPTWVKMERITPPSAWRAHPLPSRSKVLDPCEAKTHRCSHARDALVWLYHIERRMSTVSLATHAVITVRYVEVIEVDCKTTGLYRLSRCLHRDRPVRDAFRRHLNVAQLWARIGRRYPPTAVEPRIQSDATRTALKLLSQVNGPYVLVSEGCP